MISTLFVHPMSLPAWAILPMLLPMLLAVAIVYKTIRVPRLDMLLKQATRTFLYLTVGIALLGGAMWLLMIIFI